MVERCRGFVREGRSYRGVLGYRKSVGQFACHTIQRFELVETGMSQAG